MSKYSSLQRCTDKIKLNRNAKDDVDTDESSMSSMNGSSPNDVRLVIDVHGKKVHLDDCRNAQNHIERFQQGSKLIPVQFCKNVLKIDTCREGLIAPSSAISEYRNMERRTDLITAFANGPTSSPSTFPTPSSLSSRFDMLAKEQISSFVTRSSPTIELGGLTTAAAFGFGYSGGFQPSFLHSAFWDRYYVLQSKASRSLSPSFLERSEILLQEDDFEKHVLTSKVKQLISDISWDLLRIDQHDITEVERQGSMDDEDVPFDMLLAKPMASVSQPGVDSRLGLPWEKTSNNASSNKTRNSSEMLNRKSVSTYTANVHVRQSQQRTHVNGLSSGPCGSFDESYLESLDFASRCDLAGLLLGRSKVFVRRETYDRLETMRTDVIYKSALTIQNFARCAKLFKKIKALNQKNAAIKMQSRIRTMLAINYRRTLQNGTCTVLAAVRIQTIWRMHVVQKYLKEESQTKIRQKSITKLQSAWRGYVSRKKRNDKSCVNLAKSANCIITNELVGSPQFVSKIAMSINETVDVHKDIQQLGLDNLSKNDETSVSTNTLIRLPVVVKIVEAPHASTRSTNAFSSTATKLTNTNNSTHTNSIVVVDNDVLLNELYHEIDVENWVVVDVLLEKYPDLCRAPDVKTGELLIHKLVRHNGVWPELLNVVVLTCPAALQHKDNMGALPIHHAAAFDNVSELKIVYEAYNDGIFAFDKTGRLPIHVASMYDAVDSVKFLLSKSSDLANISIYRPATNVGGGLSLHVACNNNASIGVIESLIAANVASVKKTDENGDLPLHLLLRCGEVTDLAVVRTLITCFPGALSRTDASGNLPLAVAIKYRCPYAIVHAILHQYPEAARILNGDHQTPLVSAIVQHAEDRTILSLLNHAPELATAVDLKTGLLPLQFATEYEQSHFIVHDLLKRDLPVDISEKVRAKLIPHHFSWNHIVSNTDDLYHSVVSQILKSCTQPQVLALAHVEGPDGRSALTTATVICKYEIRVMLRLFGTLEVMTERPAYSNEENGTQIFYAIRYDPPPQQPGTTNAIPLPYSTLHDQGSKHKVGHANYNDDYLEDYDDNTHVSTASRNSIRSTLTIRSQQTIEDRKRYIRDEKGVHVIAKLTSRSEIVERELRIRKEFQLSRHYVPAVLSVHHTVQHAAYYEAMAESGFCLTMEGADATAENQLYELIRSDRRVVAKTLKRIGISLLHLHEHGLVHGDFGAHNIGKFGSRWKLLSVGGCVRIGAETNADRGLYQPPEAIYLENKQHWIPGSSKKQLRAGTASIMSVEAQPTYDIWAFGVFLFEIIAGVPLGVYNCRGKSPMTQSELHQLGTWDDLSLRKELLAIEPDDVARDLLRRLLHHDPKVRLDSMRSVMDHRFFTGAKSPRSCDADIVEEENFTSIPSHSTTDRRLSSRSSTSRHQGSGTSSHQRLRSKGMERKKSHDNSDDSSIDESGGCESESTSLSTTPIRSPLRIRGGLRKWRTSKKSVKKRADTSGPIVESTRIQI